MKWLTLLHLVPANIDQALATEPRLHDDPPQGGGPVVIAVCRLSDHTSITILIRRSINLATDVI